MGAAANPSRTCFRPFQSTRGLLWPGSVSQIIREVGSLYTGVRDGLELRIEIPLEEVHAVVDPVALRQALVNLLDNAVDAVPGGGTITISLQVKGDDLGIEVTDTGVGLPTESTETLVQPFFSTKGRGSGMGLALVHRIVTDHGGELELENRRPSGALVRITLPQALIHEPQADGLEEAVEPSA